MPASRASDPGRQRFMAVPRRRSQAQTNSARNGAAKERDRPPEMFFRKKGMTMVGMYWE